MASDHRGRPLHAGKRTNQEDPDWVSRVQNAYALLQAAHQDMSPTAGLMSESEGMYDNKYVAVARDMASHPETATSRIRLAKGGLIL